MIIKDKRSLRFIAMAASILLACSTGCLKVSAAEIVRYSSPAAGITPEIPVNAQGLPALPDEPQVLGAGAAQRRPAENRRPGPEEASAAGQSTGMDASSGQQGTRTDSAADSLGVFDSYAGCVQAVGFDFPMAGKFALLFEQSGKQTLYRGLPGVVMETAFFEEDGEYIILRKGIGHSDLAADVKDCDQAIVMRDVPVGALIEFLASQGGRMQEYVSGRMAVLQTSGTGQETENQNSELLQKAGQQAVMELGQENCSAIVRFNGEELQAVTVYSDTYTYAVIISGI